MKILLIHPLQRGRHANEKKVQAYIPPLTLPTLAGLTPKNIQIELCDESVDSVDFNAEADLIGITGITSQINRAYEIADVFRTKGKTIIMGGMHVSALPDEAKEFADSVVIGEADDIWEQILDDYQNKSLKSEYKSNNYPDLKRLVIPRYNLLKLNRYRKSTGTNIPRLPIQATRGCPFNCSFCSVTRFWGPKVRMKPLENVERELLHIKSLGTNRIFFTDDNFIADVNYTRELIKLIIKHDFTFFCQVSTNIQKHEDIIEQMGKARCTGVFMGIESFSQQNLDIMNKKINSFADYKKLFGLLNRANIQITASIILGLDGDTRESMEETLKLLKDFKVSHVQLYLPAFLPGTELREQFLRDKRIIDDNWDHQNACSVTFQPKNISTEELINDYWKLYKKFYSYKSIADRILSYSTLKLGLKTSLIRLNTNLYYRKRIQSGMHPYEN
jgi:radical SAM superfamily enzyme YgiQ (UPF0313 family)